jgi:hypothetical protein
MTIEEILELRKQAEDSWDIPTEFVEVCDIALKAKGFDIKVLKGESK